MRTNAAAAFILSGAALILLRREPGGPKPAAGYRLGQALALAAGLIGLLTLTEYAFNWNLGIDRLLVKRVPGDFWSNKSPRMPAMAALNFVLVGLALFIIDVKVRGRDWWSQVPATAAALVGLLGFAGYSYGAQALYSVGGPTLMALNSAIIFILFGLGIVFARPDRGIMKVLASDMEAGRTARRLLAGVVMISLVIAPLTFAGETWGFYGAGFGASLFTIFSVILLSFVVFITSFQLQQAEIAQSRSETDVAKARNELEIRVQEQTADLRQTNQRLQTQMAERQAAEENVRLLSTPVLRLRSQLLMLPIIGVLDSRRADQLMDQLLDAVRAGRARVAILDITGTTAIDSAVALRLVQAAEAARLLGTKVILTGISRENAQTLVRIGVGLGDIDVGGDLQSGIDAAERSLGLKIVKIEGEAA